MTLRIFIVGRERLIGDRVASLAETFNICQYRASVIVGGGLDRGGFDPSAPWEGTVLAVPFAHLV